jgi:hypothetical protein
MMATAIRAWHRWRSLRWSDRLSVMRGLALLAVARVLLRRSGLARCLERVAAISVDNHAKPIALSQAVVLARAFDAAARHWPLRSTCLTRSLVIAWLLRRRGADVCIRLGVKVAGGDLSAHAWTEWNGQVLADSPESVAGFATLTGAG